MKNLANMIERAANGEFIEAAVIGAFNGYENDRNESFVWKVLSWQQARHHLDYDYDDNFGAPDCHPVIVWTANWVIGISEYDGSTSISRVPRHPVACKPYYMNVD